MKFRTYKPQSESTASVTGLVSKPALGAFFEVNPIAPITVLRNLIGAETVTPSESLNSARLG